MSEPTTITETEPDPDPADIEPEDPGEDLSVLEGPTDVPDGDIEDDTGFLHDVSIFAHLDDDAPGPVGTQDSDGEGGPA